MLAPDGVKSAPVLGFVAFRVFDDHAIGPACQCQLAVFENLDKLRAPFDSRAIVRKKRLPGSDDFVRAPDDCTANKSSVAIEKRSECVDILIFGRLAECDLLAPDDGCGICRSDGSEECEDGRENEFVHAQSVAQRGWTRIVASVAVGRALETSQ